TVVIAQVLISGKEPNSIAAQRTAEIRREVTVLDALESAERLAPRDREPNRLAGEARPLSIVRRVVQETIPPLPGDDVEHGALDVAVLSGCSDSLDLDFLNDVHARFGARYPAARTGEVRAVDEKQVLVAAGAERGNGVDRAASGRSG